MIKYLGPCDGLETGYYFVNEIEEPIGPYKTEWDAELVLTVYIINIIECQGFLHLNLNKFLQLRKVF